jgi:hypothetical protein
MLTLVRCYGFRLDADQVRGASAALDRELGKMKNHQYSCPEAALVRVQ